MSQKLLLATFAISFCALVCVVQGSVLGIDLGGEFMKISSISPGKSFVIVENTATRRKTQSAIAFHNNERWFEADAVQKRSRALTSTFTFIQKYLGKPYDETLIQKNKEKYFEAYKFEKEEEKGTFQFAVDGFRIKEDEPLSFTVEELVSMYLKHAKVLADKQANLTIKDVVITVPPYYGIPERYALIDAIQLAGLNPLSFIHENTAAALYYAIERKDENKTHTVLFYNLGSTSLKVSLVEFSMENSTEKNEKNKKYESFTVLADAWEENVNGYLFDINLAKWLADNFDNQPSRKGKNKARDSPSAMAKILKEANKAKEVLSANKETSVYIESLIDDVDLKATIQRSQFEELNQAEFQLLTAPIQKVLEATGKTLADIDAIEVLGGALRVPKVQQILQDFVGKNTEVGAHMNGDEAMALGTSFHAASLSSSFKTRTIYMNDGLNFEIYATIRGLGDEDEGEEGSQAGEKFEKNTTLFGVKQKLGSKKALTFTYDKDLKVILFTRGPNGEEEIFTTYRITKVSDIASKVNENTTAPKISLTFKLTSLGLVDLIKSEVYVEETKLIEETTLPSKNKASKKNKATTSDDTSSDEAGETQTGSSTPENETLAEGQAAEETNGTSTESPQSDSEAEKKYKQKVITHTKELTVNRLIPSHLRFSEAKLKALAKNLKKIEEFEELKKKRAEAKNRLESFVYRSQELAGDEGFQTFSTEEELDDLKKMALDNEDWLYTDEAKAADHTVFDGKFEKMFSLAKRIIFRAEQAQIRDKVISDAYKALDSHVSKIKALNSSKPWIKESEKDEVLAYISKTRDWLDEKVAKLKEQKKTDDPIVTTDAIEGKINTLKNKFATLKATPKPKSEKDSKDSKAKPAKDAISDDLLFDIFLKYKNITISGVDDSFKSMFRNSMKSEYETWKADFMKNFTESINQGQKGDKAGAETGSTSDQKTSSDSQEQKTDSEEPKKPADDEL